MNRLDLAVLELKRLKEAGIDAWIAGGAVRDMLTGSVPRDVDLVIRTDELALRSLYSRMHRVGRKHPVFLIFPWNEAVEVTLLQSDIQTDLLRRDFTWNAMALDAEKRLIDPAGGAEDLHQRRLTAPGDAVEKIKDDPVRILRAVRFSLQYDGEIAADLFSCDGRAGTASQNDSIRADCTGARTDTILMLELHAVGAVFYVDQRGVVSGG
ncbi:CCA tRNA nucleotidyltransferase [Alkalicoccus urumqiensis]|uniref:Poly A polymerase head domain-containing protein n=1 Tax=Alkalicoccus urumqiensis TaxID=1548213 RepID=A0A2P6MKM3_ALKUR|nr:CCA tRNA nucleotidyltransferase [Alkalicoccus urumqiensis]PRO66837.1 hypothetical protein C6I21_02630 [Alkalicoccus urumqiensis]